jgi:hypothetical protein
VCSRRISWRDLRKESAPSAEDQRRSGLDETRDIFLDRGWLIMVRDLDIDPEDVLRRAGLPLEMLHQETSRVTVKEHFAMLAAVEELADDPLLPIRIGQSASPEAFAAPIFRCALQLDVGGCCAAHRCSQATHRSHARRVSRHEQWPDGQLGLGRPDDS